MVLAPPTTTAFITPMSSLSLAAARDPAVLEELDISYPEAIGSRTLLSYVFKKYGYDEKALGMDLLTFEGATIARPVVTAFYGTNIQLAGVMSILSSTLVPLLGLSGASRRLLGSSADVAQVQDALMNELLTNIFGHLKVDPTTSYFKTGDADVIQGILNETYTNIATQFSDAVPVVKAVKLSELFAAIAKVSTSYVMVASCASAGCCTA